ncbi:MAG TPA: HpcH/HpaI aldolase/citrate lyase family protein [Arthrobacter sp.]|nr:HpcH/HpaI aldolase/citrate lyase family protein [Arthrobacter sp.]
MQHFKALAESVKERLFHVRPEVLGRASDPGLLAVALGATLYSPATRTALAQDIRKQAKSGCLSTVICLEDAVPDDGVPGAEENLLAALAELSAVEDPAELPLIFIRCRTPEQLLDVGRRAGAALGVVYGFVLPKFENETGRGRAFLEALQLLNEESGRTGDPDVQALRAMPIIEDPVTTHLESRVRVLTDNLALINEFRELVLCVRVGATDMSSAFGLRRSRDLTIYNVKVVANIIGDVVNIFGRPDGWIISGPVWEHFVNTERVLRPQLRSTPFEAANEVELRQRILMDNLDGLIREIELDQANGLLGKTVIHPSHVPVVHSMSVVSHEEYLDAVDIAGTLGGGVKASSYGNKMNESKPHRAWAERTLLRARAFGVARPDVNFVDLLEASMR